MVQILISMCCLVGTPLDTVPQHALRWIPPGYHTLEYAVGDLNGDTYVRDLALVIDSGTVCRSLLLMCEGADGSYQLVLRNDSIIGDVGSGGSFGDPYEDVVVNTGTIGIYHQGGTRNLWRRDRIFRWEPETSAFVLDTVNESWVDRLNPAQNYHHLHWSRDEFGRYLLDTMTYSDEIEITSVSSSSEFPHRSAQDVDASWVEVLLDTSRCNITADQATSVEHRPEFFLATELPTALATGTMYLVQPSREPYARGLHGAHATFFWILEAQDAEAENESRHIRKIFVSGMVDFVTIDHFILSGYPRITLAWGYADRLEESVLEYDSANDEYRVVATNTRMFEDE